MPSKDQLSAALAGVLKSAALKTIKQNKESVLVNLQPVLAGKRWCNGSSLVSKLDLGVLKCS